MFMYVFPVHIKHLKPSIFTSKLLSGSLKLLTKNVEIKFNLTKYVRRGVGSFLINISF